MSTSEFVVQTKENDEANKNQSPIENGISGLIVNKDSNKENNFNIESSDCRNELLENDNIHEEKISCNDENNEIKEDTTTIENNENKNDIVTNGNNEIEDITINENNENNITSLKKMKETIENTVEENKTESQSNNLLENFETDIKTKQNVNEEKSKVGKEEENVYKLKVIEKKNEYQGIIQQKNIITQNINGPCPLLALCNILILRGDISIPLKKTEISYEEIIDILGDYIARNTNIGNDSNTNSNNNVNSNDNEYNDVLDIIPTLKKGLDINVKFDSVLSFEPSPAFTVFKYFNIKLVHGWTVDPEDKETYRIIVEECGNYNKVVEKIIESESACTSKNDLTSSEESIESKNRKEELYHTGVVCKNFIESNATQLTYHGLTSIPDVLEVGEPTAFFRNNHFLTLIKTEDNNMYTLVTDQGFVNEKRIVWESLSTLDGDSIFVDGLFQKYNESSNNDELILNTPNEDLDYAIALSLQDEENKKNERMNRINEEAIRQNQNHSGRKSGSNSNKELRHQNNSMSNNGRKSNYNNTNNNKNSKYSNMNKSKSKEMDDDKCLIM